MSIVKRRKEIEITRSIIESPLVFFGLNRLVVGNDTAIAEMERQLQIARVMDQMVYFIIEEECNWKKPPFNAYAVLPTSLQPANTSKGFANLRRDLDAIMRNLDNYLSPNVTGDDEYNRYKSLIEEAKISNALLLKDVGLTAVPSFVFTLTNLRSLDLSKNDLLEMPGDISNLLNLETLSLMDNKRLQSLPESITKLPKLTSLYLSGTCLNQFPDGFPGMKRLVNLGVDNTALQVLDPELFFDLRLKYFSIHNNNILNLPDTLRYGSLAGEGKKHFESIRSKHNDYLSVIEINSDSGKPEYDHLFKDLKKKARYAYFDNVHDTLFLFRIISEQSSSRNTVVYLRDEKNILGPAFRKHGNESLVIGQFFRAFHKPLNLVINNPAFHVESLKMMAENGNLNLVAIRTNPTNTSQNFAELFFGNIVGKRKVAAPLWLCISITQPKMQLRPIIERELRKKGYELIFVDNSGYKDPGKDFSYLPKCDVLVFVIDDDTRMISSADSGPSPKELYINAEYEEAIRLGKEVVVCTNILNYDRFHPSVTDFLTRVMKVHNSLKYGDTHTLVDYIDKAGQSIMKRGTSFREVVNKLKPSSTDHGYDIYFNETSLVDFSLDGETIADRKEAKTPSKAPLTPLSWLAIDIHQNQVGIITTRVELYTVSLQGKITKTTLGGTPGKVHASMAGLNMKKKYAFIKPQGANILSTYKLNIGPGVFEQKDLQFPITGICAGSKRPTYVFGKENIAGIYHNQYPRSSKPDMTEIVMADAHENGSVIFSDGRSVEIWTPKKRGIIRVPFKYGVDAICFNGNEKVIVAGRENTGCGVKIYKVQNVAKFEFAAPIKSSKINSIAFHDDFFLLGTDKGGELWSIKGHLLSILPHSEANILLVAFDGISGDFVLASTRYISFYKLTGEVRWIYDLQNAEFIKHGGGGKVVSMRPNEPFPGKMAKKKSAPVKRSAISKKSVKAASPVLPVQKKVVAKKAAVKRVVKYVAKRK